MKTRALFLSLLLTVAFLGGCGSRRYTTTLTIPANNRAALHIDKGSPRVTVVNRGPADVLVKFNQSGDSSSAVEVQSNKKITRDIDTPGEVILETGPTNAATVFCVIERCDGLVIDAAKPK